MVGDGRELCGLSGPNPLVKQSHLQQAALDLVQVSLNISREGESTSSLGSLFQCSVTLRVKQFFLVFRWNFLCFRLCPLPLVLSLSSLQGKTFQSLSRLLVQEFNHPHGEKFFVISSWYFLFYAF